MKTQGGTCRAPARLLAGYPRDDGGQAVTEYMVILALVLGGAVLLARGFVDVMDRGILKLGSQIEKDLHTGKTPANAWRN